MKHQADGRWQIGITKIIMITIKGETRKPESIKGAWKIYIYIFFFGPLSIMISNKLPYD